MKKIFYTLAITASLLIFGLSSTVFAQFSGVYVEPKFIFSSQKAKEPRINNVGNLGSKTDSTWGGALAVGYNFDHYFDYPIRVELEYGLRGKTKMDWSIASSSIRGEHRVQTFFANVYWDIPLNAPITPYIGGGLGLALLDADYYFKDAANKYKFSDDKTNFAWNLGAGAGYDINENITASLGYRFNNFGNTKPSGSAGTEYVSGKATTHAHEMNLGLRYSF